VSVSLAFNIYILNVNDDYFVKRDKIEHLSTSKFFTCKSNGRS